MSTKRQRRRAHHARELRSLKAKVASVSSNTARSCGTQQASIAQLKQRQANTQALQSTLNSMLIEVNEKLNQRVTQLTFLVAAAFILSFAAALVLGGRHG